MWFFYYYCSLGTNSFALVCTLLNLVTLYTELLSDFGLRCPGISQKKKQNGEWFFFFSSFWTCCCKSDWKEDVKVTAVNISWRQFVVSMRQAWVVRQLARILWHKSKWECSAMVSLIDHKHELHFSLWLLYLWNVFVNVCSLFVCLAQMINILIKQWRSGWAGKKNKENIYIKIQSSMLSFRAFPPPPKS